MRLTWLLSEATSLAVSDGTTWVSFCCQGYLV